MIKVEKGIPIPEKPRKGGKPAKYPWATMDVGDSFFVEGVPLANFASGAYNAAKLLNRKFSLRTVEGGVRVWRIT